MPQRPRRPETIRAFESTVPEVWAAYLALRDACDRSGPLPPKTRELIKIGIEIAKKRRGGLVAHINRARQAGATHGEIYQAIVLAAPLVGMPDTLDAFRIARRHLD